MSRRRLLTLPRHPWVVWFALLIAVLGAVVPTVSHALVWSQAGAPSYGAICTTAGSLSATAAPASGQDSAPSMVHCPFCLHSSDRAAPPPSPLLCPLLIGEGRHAETVSQTVFSSTRHTFVPPPRGPPSF